ncbi:MAG: ABC transporter ATP-binding protein [Deltaproteobacteria bacterium]|jgi:ABC-type Fe3+/spermidine/putrescine transport system ATPase subunit|nr:ABC transporter ATP-binding protein [Deltaproteobacteria bacterium]MCL5880891.1 ABC transporter ATP-binding protein [Deltaproteobacteria bacterium]MDA8303726.1 ABC transporter ATP-binding protein [Deltaproteobacteria bacterium]
MNLLEIKNICKSFSGKKVLNGINLNIESGEISSIFGYSGEGKSTLLKIICGIIKQDNGDIMLNGKNINNLESYERRAALVMDEPLLFPHMNVFENIAFGSKLSSNKKRHINNNKGISKSAKEIMELLGITGLEERYPNEISMGQAQRVSLARALIVNPKIILMDEPFSNLDIISKTKVRRLIKDINSELKISMLLVTHDIEDVLNLSNKMFILNNGKIQDSGKPKDVLKKPSSMDAAFLLGTENIFEGIVSEIDEKNNLIKIKLLNGQQGNSYIEADFQGDFEINEQVFFVIRSEEIIILREDRQASKPVKENHFSGKIISSVFTSRMMEIMIGSGDASLFKVLIPFHAYEVMNLFEGKTVNISLKKSAIHIIKKKKPAKP